jgi:hypothetical protein
MNNPHPNIVRIYAATPEKIDMELVRPVDDVDFSQLELAKEHMQNLGISYMDWKIDNVGIGRNGKLKVYDFDSSCLFDGNTFTHLPNNIGFRHANARKNGYVTPRNINNASFRAMKEHTLHVRTRNPLT